MGGNYQYIVLALLSLTLIIAFNGPSPATDGPTNASYISFNDGFSSTVGDAANLSANDDTFYAVRRTNDALTADNLEAYLNVTYNITALNITPQQIVNVTVSIVHCLTNDVDGAYTCGSTPDGTPDNPQRIALYNWTSGAHEQVTTFNLSTIGTARTDSFTRVTDLTDYIHNDQIVVRYEADVDITTLGDDAAWGVDHAPLTVRYDDTPPNVTSLGPTGTLLTTQIIELAANVTDDRSIDAVTANVTLPNGTIDTVSLTPATGNVYNASYTVPNISGSYTVAYIATDAYTNVNDTETASFTGDGDGPNITLLEPDNATTVYGTNVTYTYQVNDSLSSVANCSLIVDSAPVQTDTSIAEGTQESFTLDTAVGSHTYEITCTDGVGTSKTSEERTFTVSDKDLTVANVTVSDTSPVEGQNVTVNATIENIGSEEVTQSFNITFTDSSTTGSDVLDTTLVNGLNAGANVSVSTSWNASVGAHSLLVQADTPLENGSVQETDESNNEDAVNVSLTVYQTVYGTFQGSITLADSELRPLQNFTDTDGNILVTETGLDVSFTSLQALSRTTSLTYDGSDFVELDEALNTSAYPDNVNATWTSAGQPVATRNYNVFGSTVANVPVVNSTNTSAFQTGILWDSADGGTSYDGSQDVVFITSTAPDTQGRYGTYDYEVTFPAQLRDYKESGSRRVTFYYELE